MNPVRDRTDGRTDAVAFPAIASLRAALSSGKDAELGYVKWRKDSWTVGFLKAIAEYADNQPVEVGNPDKALVQYGMSCGIDLVYRLMTQPSRVFPEAFSGKSMPVYDHVLDQAYTDTPDSVLDQME